MSYVVLARKWRPQTFDDLVGQRTSTRILKNAIELGRVPHALLFTGTRGVGKTTSARIMAKALNCEAGPTIQPCNTCTNCKETSAGISVDVMEIDGASNTSVDDVRELREGIQYSPSKSRFKIYIIDEVHMLSNSAFNALLKTLEEPPSHVKFIFATTEAQKIPETILSRCQRFDFKEVPEELLVAHLKKIAEAEKLNIEEAALRLVAKQAAGSVRDALSVLDQVIALVASPEDKIAQDEVSELLGLTDRALLEATFQAFQNNDIPALQTVIENIIGSGVDLKSYVLELLENTRHLMFIKSGADMSRLSIPETQVSWLQTCAENVEIEELERWFDLIKKCSQELAWVRFPKLVLETTLLRVCREVPRKSIQEILQWLQEGKAPEQLKQVAPNTPSQPRFSPSHTSEPSKKESLPPRSAVKDNERSEPYKSQHTPPVDQGASTSLETIIQKLKEKKPGVAAIIKQAAKLKMEDDALTLNYDEKSFYLERAQQAEFKEAVVNVGRELFGDKFRLIVEANQATPKAAAKPLSQQRSQRESEILKDPKVQKTLSLFDARVEEVKTRS